MFAGSGRDGNFDLGVGAGEVLEVGFEEGAVEGSISGGCGRVM